MSKLTNCRRSRFISEPGHSSELLRPAWKEWKLSSFGFSAKPPSVSHPLSTSNFQVSNSSKSLSYNLSNPVQHFTKINSRTVVSSSPSHHHSAQTRHHSLISNEHPVERQQTSSHRRKRRCRFQDHCCRINVLLITMQLALGSSMTCLSLYLYSLSPSVTTAQCSYWASIPLFLVGILCSYFCGEEERMFARHGGVAILRNLCMLASFLCTFSSACGSVFVGYYGNRIARYSNPCPKQILSQYGIPELSYRISNYHSNNLDSFLRTSRNETQYCCATLSHLSSHDNSLLLFTSPLINGTPRDSFCVCYRFVLSISNAPSSSLSMASAEIILLEPAFSYAFLKCSYVISSLKDYMILQCSLMAVAAIVCFWFARILCMVKRAIQSHSNQMNFPNVHFHSDSVIHPQQIWKAVCFRQQRSSGDIENQLPFHNNPRPSTLHRLPVIVSEENRQRESPLLILHRQNNPNDITPSHS